MSTKQSTKVAPIAKAVDPLTAVLTSSNPLDGRTIDALVEVATRAAQDERDALETVKSVGERVAILNDQRRTAEATARQAGATVARIAYVVTTRKGGLSQSAFGARIGVGQSRVSALVKVGKALTAISPAPRATDAAGFAALESVRNQHGSKVASDVVRRVEEARKRGDDIRIPEAIAAAVEDATTKHGTERPVSKVSTLVGLLSTLAERLSKVDAVKGDDTDHAALLAAAARLSAQVERLAAQVTA